MSNRKVEMLIDNLQKVIEYKKALKEKQELPILLSENLLSHFNDVKSIAEEAKSKFKQTTDEIHKMENRISRLQYVSTDDEEGIYEAQLLIAEAESLLQLGHEKKDISHEERVSKFNTSFQQINKILSTEYKNVQKKMMDSPVKGKIGPRLLLEKIMISTEAEMPSTTEELLQKIKKSGRFLKWSKSGM